MEKGWCIVDPMVSGFSEVECLCNGWAGGGGP